ncbi:MAG: hypothetical protein KIT84_01540 [Labilithrix sp.]|nr:hypothetical protein [Labilithrix sp.]MCW5809670.1 hypothetical protein [Labilithrix sp.]
MRSLRLLPLVVSLLGIAAACSTDPAATDDNDEPAAKEGKTSQAPQGNEETDVGCGGKNAPPCPENKGCKVDLDCQTGNCETGGKCGAATPDKPIPARPDDGIKNGDETDVDCGGQSAPKCGTDKGCGAAADCESQVCTDGKCAAPSPTDSVKNGDETDVDCGGANAPKCAVGKTCAAHSDCASDGCDYNKKCAVGKSCTAHFGGDTCGPGEVGDPAAKHESCCAVSQKLDKYSITAGRMRAFIERFNGNPRQFVAGLGANPNWQQAWNARVPSTLDEVAIELGPYGNDGQRQGCYLKGQGARTYWLPDNVNTGFNDEIAQKYGKDVLDTKALNCVTFYLAQAFCIWEGGRLPTLAELDAQWGGTMPWGNQAWTADRAVHKYTYAFPENQLDNSAFIAAPGRKPAGNGPNGHADLGGLVFNLTSTFNAAGQVRWSRNGSWENHQIPYGVHHSPKERAYWATGARCVHP